MKDRDGFKNNHVEVEVPKKLDNEPQIVSKPEPQKEEKKSEESPSVTNQQPPKPVETVQPQVKETIQHQEQPKKIKEEQPKKIEDEQPKKTEDEQSKKTEDEQSKKTDDEEYPQFVGRSDDEQISAEEVRMAKLMKSFGISAPSQPKPSTEAKTSQETKLDSAQREQARFAKFIGPTDPSYVPPPVEKKEEPKADGARREEDRFAKLLGSTEFMGIASPVSTKNVHKEQDRKSNPPSLKGSRDLGSSQEDEVELRDNLRNRDPTKRLSARGSFSGTLGTAVGPISSAKSTSGQDLGRFAPAGSSGTFKRPGSIIGPSAVPIGPSFSAPDKSKRLSLRTTRSDLDEEFAGAGFRDGLEIWRIENLKPVKVIPEKVGQFYSGDSYILLHTSRGGHKIHFWLGNDTTQDESTCAAIKTVELSEKLQSLAAQYREVQEHESQLFYSYFPQGVQYLDGGVESAFKHTTHTFARKLLHIKGKKNVFVKQVPLTYKSLNDGDVFILDDDKTIYVFNGKKSSRVEKAKGMSVSQHINPPKEEEKQTSSFSKKTMIPRNGKDFGKPWEVPGTSLRQNPAETISLRNNPVLR
eukprot:TRINITY_DN2573_c0_g1_i2.p1 TRINITY_DN2573_c0_g1~~TRINITY_DN2573_c0_g1_i2.p1  ORF type:complete len:677 (+),score=200.32 TRINITY_DN2573_c0_g1_i2:287-2032(+)